MKICDRQPDGLTHGLSHRQTDRHLKAFSVLGVGGALQNKHTHVHVQLIIITIFVIIITEYHTS